MLTHNKGLDKDHRYMPFIPQSVDRVGSCISPTDCGKMLCVGLSEIFKTEANLKGPYHLSPNTPKE